MNALLIVAALVLGFCVAFMVPTYGPSAILLCLMLAVIAGYIISKIKLENKFLLQMFVAGLLVRMLVGAGIFIFNKHDFFGGDAFTYDILGDMLLDYWRTGSAVHKATLDQRDVGWGMINLVAATYGLVGRNMLAVQFVNAVIGAATAPVIFLCAHHIFGNMRVSRVATIFVAFYPSLVLWSAQGLKDGPMVFLLAISMLATLKLGERISLKYILMLLGALVGVLSLRFYVFYMMVAAIGGSFVIGMNAFSAQSLARQYLVIIALGLAMLQFGVLNSAMRRAETINLEAVQSSRLDMAKSGQSGFGQDVDVSTTSGALTTIPIGMIYLLFAPFPWQLASLRQSITLPEMVVWWLSFPLLVMGLWFTLKYKMRQALPILIFTTMLTIAYSVFQGNVGTAYRQRSQLLIFYFIFVSVGYELVRERAEDRRRQAELTKQQATLMGARAAARRRQEREWERIADSISEKVGF
ncbi:MAG TPA: glycosyltransferase family 39 protein [Pyrinomonadaceae bacterium]|nr:glycosyltransferase family 39 protein [Pyrinomonadaceae bacterium]